MSGPLVMTLLHLNGGILWTVYLQVMAGWQGLQATLGFWGDSILGLGASLLYPGPPNTTMALPC